ncbi:MAG TPA: 3-deoxy-manno-octulosonate cytidylyltransferase [Chitinispirillaceae bacterium]|nr:3-deoxy-manno-octulosonate cytidylyltransferase [Chitinispirillaceae bacterium]
MSNSILCVIPARYASSRLPGKPLALIDGKPLVMWAYDRAVASGAFDRVCVATDDQRIMDEVRKHGGDAIMTSSTHSRGTDRVYEVIGKINCSHVVNLQGDEPVLPLEIINDFTSALGKIDGNSLLTIVSHATINDINRPDVVKVVLNRMEEALYFSRSLIPFERDGKGFFYKHKGIYGFPVEALKKFCSFQEGDLEKRESLEQLRALENGMRIKCLIRDFDSIGIDTPADLEAFRSMVAMGKYGVGI